MRIKSPFLSTLIIFGLLLGGCNPGNINMDGSTSHPSGTDEPLVDTHLGNISFSTDNQRSAVGEFTSDGSDFTLSVTDAMGNVWTLEIPGDALLSPETITMTPLSNIKSVDLPVEFSGGVQLAPDGLRFFKNATITVTNPGREVDGLLLTSGHDGSGLEFMMVNSGIGVSAPLQHFSTVTWEEPKKQQAETNEMMLKDLLAKHKAIIDEAKKLLKQTPDNDYPTPPDISHDCLSERMQNDADGNPSSINKQIEEYIWKFGGQEAESIRNIIEVDTALYELTGEDFFTSDKKIFDDLSYRVWDRTKKLISDYSSQPEKSLAVIHTYFESKNLIVIAGDWGDLSGELGDLPKNLFEYHMQQIEEKHNFKQIGGIMESVKLWSLFDIPNVIPANELIARLQKALQFDLHYELLYKTPDTNIQIAGDGKLGVNYPSGSTYFTQGSGEGEYVSASVTFSKDPYRIETIFPIQLLMDIDACGTNMVTLWMDKLAADTETHIVTSNGVDVKSELPGIVSMVASSIFEMETAKFIGQDEILAYVFRTDLHNGQSEIATQTFEGKYSGAQATILIQIEHTPGK